MALCTMPEHDMAPSGGASHGGGFSMQSCDLEEYTLLCCKEKQYNPMLTTHTDRLHCCNGMML